ncbi:MAG: hypothetical protein AAGC58_11270 [Asticcacaulis sp.]
MTYDPALQAELSKPVINIFCAVEIDHPYKTIRLLDGLGVLSFAGKDYVGHDPEVGSLGAVELSADGVGDTAPTLTAVLQQVSNAVAVALCSPQAQGATVQCWMGAFDPQSGQVIGIPYKWFVGEVDVPVHNLGKNVSGVTNECVAASERFFDIKQGARMNQAAHQAIWPGELGFQYLNDLRIPIPVGRPGARPQLTRITT